MKLNVNGHDRDTDATADTPLLWVLRDSLHMTGTKFGCGIAQCGACTVHLDGQAVRACVVTAAAAAGKRIVTIEGISQPEMHPVQKAWIAHEVPQCGYCQTGMIMAAVALLEKEPDPTDADIDEAMTNLCRCGSYARVREAIHAAAKRS